MSRLDSRQLANWFITHVRTHEVEGPAALDVHAVWSKLLQDAWFQQALRGCARRAAERYRMNASSADDVFDDVVVRLYATLQSDITLSYDANRDFASFPAWLHKVLWNLASTAARSMASRQKPMQTVEARDRVIDGARTLGQAIDLNLALRALPNDLRAVAYRLAKGCSQAEISRQTGMNDKRVKKLVDRVRARLSKHLDLRDEGLGRPPV